MPVNAMNTHWNDARELLLISLIDEPHSCRWLAAEINKRTGSEFTRNSIIGKMHRMGLTKAQPKISSRQNRPKKPRNRRIRPKVVVVDMFADTLPPLDFLGVPFVETNNKTCMYPEGDGAHMLFCGQPCKDESSYCASHDRICHQKATGPTTRYWKTWGRAA